MNTIKTYYKNKNPSKILIVGDFKGGGGGGGGGFTTEILENTISR